MCTDKPSRMWGTGGVIWESSMITHVCLSHFIVGSDVRHLDGEECWVAALVRKWCVKHKWHPKGTGRRGTKRGGRLRESFRTRPGSQGQGWWLIPSGGRIRNPPKHDVPSSSDNPQTWKYKAFLNHKEISTPQICQQTDAELTHLLRLCTPPAEVYLHLR